MLRKLLDLWTYPVGGKGSLVLRSFLGKTACHCFKDSKKNSSDHYVKQIVNFLV